MRNVYKFSKRKLHNKVDFIRTLWGYNFNENNYKDLIQIDKSGGFSGYEIAYSFIEKSFLKNVITKLSDEKMKAILQVHARDFNSFKKQIDEIFSNLSLTNVPIINCHLGYDYLDLESKSKLLSEVNEYFNKIKNKINIVDLSIETHRGTIFNNPNEMISVYEKSKYQTNITLDLSHFIISYERLLNNENYPQFNKMLDIFKQTKLIHMRVSTENNIQVSDPLSDYYKSYNDYYCNIWQNVIQQVNSNTKKTLFATLEYGPEPYSGSSEEAKKHLDNNHKLLKFLDMKYNH